jgi:DNA-binding NarL/FixJ family response regulator
MPDIRGLKAIHLIKTKFLSFLVLVLSLDPNLKDKVASAGVDAFISKNDPPERLWESFIEKLYDLELKPGHLIQIQKR